MEVVSTIFSDDEIVPLDTDDRETRELLEECFLQQGRISYLIRVLAFHPPHLQRFDGTIGCVLRQTGPLPLAWRSYIGVMASAQHWCGYLVQRMHIEFVEVGSMGVACHSALPCTAHGGIRCVNETGVGLNAGDALVQVGGDPAWLEGVAHVPPKLARLAALNGIMAHQPWRLGNEHIEALARGGDGVDAWSVAEMVHAMVLFSTFHAMVRVPPAVPRGALRQAAAGGLRGAAGGTPQCTLVLGSGLGPELDFANREVKGPAGYRSSPHAALLGHCDPPRAGGRC